MFLYENFYKDAQKELIVPFYRGNIFLFIVDGTHDSYAKFFATCLHWGPLLFCIILEIEGELLFSGGVLLLGLTDEQGTYLSPAVTLFTYI